MMKKTALKKIKKLLQTYIKKEVKDWIESDDKRYTSIIEEYSDKLSKHWRSTRDSYIKRTTEKSLEIDESTPQYNNEATSSDYIDGALLILAEAFRAGVLVGYEEVISRGFKVQIPEKLEELFEEAGEIRNYAHHALSYEQEQMDSIFTAYNNQENSKDKISEWFNKNEYRLTDLIIGGLIWYSINYGFTRAIIESQNEELELYWLTEKDKKVCDDCKDMEANNPYNKQNPLKTMPGGGKTICGSRCRCVIDTKLRE